MVTSTVMAAPNLPRTMSVSCRGTVSSNWSVRSRRSSVNSRMVSTGTTKISMKRICASTPPNRGLRGNRMLKVAVMPNSTRNSPIEM